MASLSLTDTGFDAFTRKSLTYSQVVSADTQVKLEVGDDELSEVVPNGKEWDVQVTICIKEISI